MNIPLYGDEFRKVFGNMKTLSPSAQDAPNMTVKISAGGFWSYLEGVAAYIEYIGGSSPAISSSLGGGNAKWTIITLNASGMVVNVEGVAAASPVLPVLSRSLYPIALVYVANAVTKLTNADIFDARPIFSNSVRSHLDLMDTSTTECHPIAAIDGLVDALAAKATSSNLTSGLATKADIAGTSSTVFKMNQAHTGAPTSDVTFEVERGDGTNVAVMWDEATEKWKYTNDGATWINFTDHYLNDGSTDLIMKMYNQAGIPTLDTDQKLAIWMDADDADKIYLVYRRNSGDQVKVQLT